MNNADTSYDAKPCVVRLLEYIGEDPNRDGLRDTPKRFIKALREMTSGNDEDPRLHLTKVFDMEDHEYDEMILSRDLPFVSLCEHHLAPFFGVAHIAYIPQDGGKVVGLSKLARVLEGYSKRLQVQERLTTQIRSAIVEALNPKGVAVMLKAKHTCQCFRGIKKDGNMVTSSLAGVFKSDPSTRAEFLQLLSV